MTLLLAGLAGLAPAGAGAEPRIALIIGNGAYRSVNALANPPHDAALMAGALKAAGFEVTLVEDGDLATMGAAVTEFGQKLRKAGPDATGLFYYAGHGVQSFGQNYLVPVDARLTNAADLSLVALDAQAVLRQMFSAHNRTNIVILDACRNNPFSAVRDLTDNGLAEMSAPTGTFLAYATAPGSVALDGLDGDSPFTKALAARIATPGLAIEQAFKDVRVEVLAKTGGKQTPWDTSSLTSDFVFVPDAAASDEAQLWANVSAARDPVQIMLFLRAYPQSVHEKEARALLSDVMQSEVKGQGEPTPAPVTGSPAAGADSAEAQAFDAAQHTATREAFAAFLSQYPNSPFAATVEAEIAALDKPLVVAAAPAPAAQAGPTDSQPARAAPPTPPAGGAGAGDVPPEMVAAIAGEAVTYSTPLTEGDPAIRGSSIEDLVASKPLFAPIDGLPKEAWAGQACTACHKWTKAALCDQAKFYVKEAAPSAKLTQHPLGGAFKLTLKAWGAASCP
ncbi:peptidase C14, caspase catalytic subunit p20 [bacterium]|nr:peptidase C14, caspase catalytic subunit p20 [bacterium]